VGTIHASIATWVNEILKTSPPRRKLSKAI